VIDTEIQLQGVRFVLKKSYVPPYLWIERYRPRKGDWAIVLSLDVNKKLRNALQELLEEVDSLLCAMERKRK